MENMLPGNSFPRSALFLVSSLRVKTIEHNGTEGLCLLVTMRVGYSRMGSCGLGSNAARIVLVFA